MEKKKVTENTIELFLKGDKAAFTEIYTTYFEPLCWFAYRFFQDKEESMEVVQDLMLKLWEKKMDIKQIMSIESYLYRSVYNACLNKLEHQKIHNKYVNHKRLKLLEMELENYEQSFYQHELRENLKLEIENLSPTSKTIFEMRYMDGLRYKEIADKLNISERTVESHLQNAIKLLKSKLKRFLLFF